MRKFRTYEFAKDFYRDCKSLQFPSDVKDQFNRALLSILLNLAEGSAKPTARDRRKFYGIALGSTREVQTILDLFQHQRLFDRANSLGAMIFRLMQNPGQMK